MFSTHRYLLSYHISCITYLNTGNTRTEIWKYDWFVKALKLMHIKRGYLYGRNTQPPCEIEVVVKTGGRQTLGMLQLLVAYPALLQSNDVSTEIVIYYNHVARRQTRVKGAVGAAKQLSGRRKPC
jgi:hypothetical protein